MNADRPPPAQRPAVVGFELSAQGITYRETRSMALVFTLTLLAVVCTVVAYRSLADGPGQAGRVAGWWPVLLAALWLALGAFLLLVALAPLQVLHFDAQRRQLHGRVRACIVLTRPVSTAFDRLAAPTVAVIEREARADVYAVQLGLPPNKPLRLGVFVDRTEAEHWCNRLAALFAAAPGRAGTP